MPHVLLKLGEHALVYRRIRYYSRAAIGFRLSRFKLRFYQGDDASGRPGAMQRLCR